jgi:hypothetical protein
MVLILKEERKSKLSLNEEIWEAFATNSSLCLIIYTPRHEEKYGSGGIPSLFLTSVLDGSE